MWLLRFSHLLLIFVAGLFATPALAKGFCFTLAENYYEQVYCELQAKGKSKALPAFRDFRQNTPATQALLLKRPAQRLGIKVPMPQQKPKRAKKAKKAAKANKPPQSTPVPQTGKTARQQSPFSTGAYASCLYQQGLVTCGNHQYRLLNNLPNNRLTGNALDKSNRLGMPAFQGNISDSSVVGSYLSSAYSVYVKKMMEIGLAGVTMSYAKFEFFFYDITEKGISFSQRFETLFAYLKKDKRALHAAKVSAPQNLNPGSCQQPLPQVLSCPYQGRNFLFATDSVRDNGSANEP